MCRSADMYAKYDACHLMTSTNDGFMARITRSEAKPGTPHQIIVTSIQRCPAAMQGPPNNTCSTIEDLMPMGVMKEAAFTTYDGPCPACIAAEDAVKKACHLTQYVDYPIAHPTIGGPSQQSKTDEEKPHPSSSKKKHKEHKQHKERKERRENKEYKSSKKHPNN